MYQEEHMKVSMVSVSRRAGASHWGQATWVKVGCPASGDSPVGRNSASSGRSTGRSSSGTGTMPQAAQ